MKRTGAQVIFYFILPIRDSIAGRGRHSMQINTWLCGWCHHLSFSFCDNGTFCDEYRLLGRDGIHLPRRGKRIIGGRLVDLVNHALN